MDIGRHLQRWLLEESRLPVPRQQFVEAADRVAGDAAKDIGEPGLGIDVVEPGSLAITKLKG
jgi:hypothetical protein